MAAEQRWDKWLRRIVYVGHLVLAICVVVVLGTGPKVLEKFVTGPIEQAHQREMEMLQAKLTQNNRVFEKAIELAYAEGTEHQEERIKVITQMWTEMGQVKKAFSRLIAVDTIFSDREINSMLKRGPTKPSMKAMAETYERYSDIKQVARKLGLSDRGTDTEVELDVISIIATSTTDKLPVFVSNRLVEVYQSHVSIYSIAGWLAGHSWKKRNLYSWRQSVAVESLARRVITEEEWESFAAREKGGLERLLIHLENLFIQEARRITQLRHGLPEVMEEIIASIEPIARQYDEIISSGAEEKDDE